MRAPVYPLIIPLAGLVAAAALPCAQAAPLRLDPASPPTLVSGDGPYPVYRFGPRGTLPVLPAVLLQLQPGATPPAGAEPLGGPFWRLTSDAPVEDALAWLGRPGVAAAFPDVVLPIESRAPVEFDDPGYGGQWYLEELEMASLFDLSLGDPGTVVAVIDSGIDIAHVDLVDAVVAPYDAFSDDDDPSPDPGEFCTGPGEDICDTHGTSVSGIVAARANNGAGMVGLCPQCTLVPIKMLGDTDKGLSVTLRAFEHAIEQDAAVINNSWGYTTSIAVPELLATAIRRATTEPRDGLGAVVVFAAGNDDRAIEDDEMEAMPEVLCVSATDSYGYPTNYTNYGGAVDVSAPSATVTIAPGDEMTTTFGGTSAAAPVVSGLLGWATSVAPTMPAAELQALLVETAVQSPLITPDEDGHHEMYGYGEISPPALLVALVGGEDTADPTDSAPADTGEPKRACACAATPGAGAGVWGLVLGLGLAARRRVTARSRTGSSR